MASTSETLTGLRAPNSVKDICIRILSFADKVKEFDQNLDYSSTINGLSGQAQVVALDIHNNIIPKLKTHGNNLLTGSTVGIKSVQGIINGFVNTSLFMGRVSNPDSIKKYLTNVQLAVSNTSTDLIKLGKDFDIYHTDINNLISSYNSENIALEHDREALEQERKKTLQELHDKAHTACGVIKSMGEAITGKLKGDINNLKDTLKSNSYQYQFDTLAIGSLTNLINLSKDFQNAIEQQQATFRTLNTRIGILSEDLDELLQDMSDWEIYWQLIGDDWFDVSKSFPA